MSKLNLGVIVVIGVLVFIALAIFMGGEVATQEEARMDAGPPPVASEPVEPKPEPVSPEADAPSSPESH